MGTVIDRSVIEKLSVEERLALVELIWDTISEQNLDEEPMSDELFNELERRTLRARSDPATTLTMTEFEARLKARWKRRFPLGSSRNSGTTCWMPRHGMKHVNLS